MAFVQRIQSAVKFVRPLSSSAAAAGGKRGEDVQKSVFISQSNDVFTNLALEQWLHQNFDFERHHVMLYYKNDPCVVLGNAENPWLDTNMSAHPAAGDKPIVLARRSNENATQYNDGGAINFTFFGSNVEHKYNLGVIARGMFRKFGVSVNQNDDGLSFYNMKLSSNGTIVNASNGNNSYQNCTLFVDVNKKDMKNAMSKDKMMESNKSFLNVNEIDPRITTGGLLAGIGWEYMRTVAHSLKDGGDALARRQRGFQMINPTEAWFPGITAMRDALIDWEWCYGATPRFSIFRTFQVPQSLLNQNAGSNDLRVKLDVDNGRIADLSLVVPPGLLSSGFAGEAKIISGIKGQKFSEAALNKLENDLGLEQTGNEREKFVKECVKKAMVI